MLNLSKTWANGECFITTRAGKAYRGCLGVKSLACTDTFLVDAVLGLLSASHFSLFLVLSHPPVSNSPYLKLPSSSIAVCPSSRSHSFYIYSFVSFQRICLPSFSPPSPKTSLSFRVTAQSIINMRYSIAAIFALASSALAQTAGFAVLTKPATGEKVPAGETYTVVWTPNPKWTGPVTLTLMGGVDNTKLQLLDPIASRFHFEPPGLGFRDND